MHSYRQAIAVALATANPFPEHLLIVVTFWASLLFLGDGLVATSNAVTVAAHFFGAIAVACAVFLILELSHPYSGVIRLSPAPHNRLMVQLGEAAKVPE